jgi:hypothetical protein
VTVAPQTSEIEMPWDILQKTLLSDAHIELTHADIPIRAHKEFGL